MFARVKRIEDLVGTQVLGTDPGSLETMLRKLIEMIMKLKSGGNVGVGGLSEHQIRKIISAEKGGVTEAQVRQFISEDSGLANNNALLVMIQDLEDKLERVEGRVSCVPVMIGDEIFQSKEDLTTFIQKNLPSNKFEYVLDALSLMEVVSDESSSFQDVMKQKE